MGVENDDVDTVGGTMVDTLMACKLVIDAKVLLLPFITDLMLLPKSRTLRNLLLKNALTFICVVPSATL